ncbi:hypothetical protein CPB83DRAFT_888843 [Crepidotus variabilis]|uniref:Uncharacterized protein n=1 Tax=Crepidotus variabilis TaxID=179855 RepID=A0A9P6ETH9_9AGAR|nr:hypothetical protein CPB83DRAFT_888843 [Crepidotus variabilis]
MPSIFIVERHDYQHHTDEIVRKHFCSAHTTLKAANKKAKALLYRYLNTEDDNGLAQIEDEGIQNDGTYLGTVRLFQDYSEDGKDTTVVSVFETDLRDESWGAFSDDDEADEFKEATGGFSSDEDEDAEGENDDEGEEEEEIEVKNRSPPQQAPRKHARTSSAATIDRGGQKRVKTLTGSKSQPIELGSSP